MIKKPAMTAGFFMRPVYRNARYGTLISTPYIYPLISVMIGLVGSCDGNTDVVGLL